MADEPKISAAEVADSIEMMVNRLRIYERGFEIAAFFRGLEQNERELNARIDKARAEAEKVESDHEAWLKKVEDDKGAEQKRADEVQRKLKDETDRILAARQSQLDSMVNAAEERQRTAEEAERAAQERRRQAQTDEAQASAAADAAERRLADAKKQIDQLLRV